MISMTLAEAANIVGIPSAAGQEIPFCGLSIDSRTLTAGNLFVAIRGERLDGHDYLAQAAQSGAVAAIVERPVNSSLPQLIVKNTTLALGHLGTAWRNQFHLPIVAITGSNGKTTLKNMIAAIMTAACNGDIAQVLYTQGTLNNQWGLPITLAQLNASHRYAAIEMGMNHFGEIEYLSNLTRPHVAVITNAAASHLEGVGDVAGVARAKAEIFSGLQSDGIAVLNHDDAFFPFWQGLMGRREYITFGFHPAADIRASMHDGESRHITLQTPNGEIDIHLPLFGKHNIQNALAAAAASLSTGIDLPAIKAGLEKTTAAKGRLQLHKLGNHVQVIDDTYNANPFSLQAAVESLAAFNGQKILVLGDMKELGQEEKSLHHAAGKAIRDAGIDYLFTFGELSEQAALAFGKGASHFKEQEKLVHALKPFLHHDATILVKGSRSMRMENVVNQLIELEKII